MCVWKLCMYACVTHIRQYRVSIVPVTDELSSTVQWWSNTERGIPKYSETNLSLCHFVCHTPHMDWSGINPKLLGESRPLTACHGKAPILSAFHKITSFVIRNSVVLLCLFHNFTCYIYYTRIKMKEMDPSLTYIAMVS